jgi:hypothetical protein
MLVLALAMAQPVSAQSFKPDFKAGHAGWGQKDYATAEYTWLVTKMAGRIGRALEVMLEDDRFETRERVRAWFQR